MNIYLTYFGDFFGDFWGFFPKYNFVQWGYEIVYYRWVSKKRREKNKRINILKMDKNFCPKLKYTNEILQKNCIFQFLIIMQQFPILHNRMPYLRFFFIGPTRPWDFGHFSGHFWKMITKNPFICSIYCCYPNSIYYSIY